ncbi:methylitaconate delta2-delta3-isomerase [Brevibacterium aurantiacum]|uniref:Methylitaconate delta2-delta3-isomerase n=2 Tax=Brevibacterium aurantiacum TaxID=273384 RepID=A0A556C1M8_BREAU|nr:methylitaconate delta2-delta3-isomerase [Brevibacterium aurantiacum]
MVNARWMRGGTSKCWAFDAEELNSFGIEVDVLLPRIFGSPDPRQLDGVGGGTSTTSKALIVERSSDDDCDIIYTFAQVRIDEARVDWGSNCGNCSAAVGLYAIERGWVEIRGDVTEIRTRNTNTGQIIIQSIPTPGGRLPAEGTETIPGTVFAGHRVDLGFLSPEGMTTGALLPAGEPRTSLAIPERRQVTVSLIDAGAPLVMINANDLGLESTEFDRWPSLIEDRLGELEDFRRSAAEAMGLASPGEEAERAVPKLGIVGATALPDADIQVLMLSMGKPHPAMPITGSVGVTIAALTPETTVAQALRGPVSDAVRIRIPSGVLKSNVYDRKDGRIVTVRRTSRTLALAQLPVPNIDD